MSGIIGDLQERGLLVLPAGPNVIRSLRRLRFLKKKCCRPSVC
ncbi:hypothetical protein QNN00_23510 [Bacillus velezensis]|nr:hypothetical protein [Bacillus velezensis]